MVECDVCTFLMCNECTVKNGSRLSVKVGDMGVKWKCAGCRGDCSNTMLTDKRLSVSTVKEIAGKTEKEEDVAIMEFTQLIHWWAKGMRSRLCEIYELMVHEGKQTVTVEEVEASDSLLEAGLGMFLLKETTGVVLKFWEMRAGEREAWEQVTLGEKKRGVVISAIVSHRKQKMRKTKTMAEEIVKHCVMLERVIIALHGKSVSWHTHEATKWYISNALQGVQQVQSLAFGLNAHFGLRNL